MTTKKSTKPPVPGCSIALGNVVVIRTVTHCVVGRVVAVSKEPFDHCVLVDAAWIADTGLEWERFMRGERGSELDVQHEPGDVTVALDAIVDARVWPHEPFVRKPEEASHE